MDTLEPPVDALDDEVVGVRHGPGEDDEEALAELEGGGSAPVIDHEHHEAARADLLRPAAARAGETGELGKAHCAPHVVGVDQAHLGLRERSVGSKVPLRLRRRG
eukprot:4627666-Prymnesium_polylepis.1